MAGVRVVAAVLAHRESEWRISKILQHYKCARFSDFYV